MISTHDIYNVNIICKLFEYQVVIHKWKQWYDILYKNKIRKGVN